MDLSLRRCTQKDIDTLCEFSSRTYSETFEHMNTSPDMEAYLNEAFNREKVRDELSDDNSEFYFLYCNEGLAGYLKLNEAPAQTDINDPASMEIERIYLLKEYQGLGLGTKLLDKAINIATSRRKQYVWLGVWERNERAFHFYKKNGFYEIGTHPFVMGSDEQTDYIMRKDLLTTAS